MRVREAGRATGDRRPGSRGRAAAFGTLLVTVVAAGALPAQPKDAPRDGEPSAASGEETSVPPSAVRFWSTHAVPLLRDRCFRCHGGAKRKSDLDLRTLEGLLRGGERGPAVVPGRPGASRVVAFVLPGADPRMPPGRGEALREEEVEVLREAVRRLGGKGGDGAGEGGPWSASREAPGRAGRRPAWAPPAGLSPRLVIDLLCERRREELGVGVAPLAGDRAFCRRVYLDLAGRIPRRDELRAFLAGTDSRKRERLVDRLLEGSEWPRRMREVLDVVLLGRGGRRAVRARREHGWHAWLERQVRENRPWDEVVRAIVLARPSRPEDRPAVWYLGERKDDHQRIAVELARGLLGIDVACAQCHDHPIAPEIEQRHHWGLVSFFSRSENLGTPRGLAVTESAVGGFGKYADLEGENHTARPLFLDGRALDQAPPPDGEERQDRPGLYEVAPPGKDGESPVGAVPKVSRREALARFLTEEPGERPLLARAFVNRMWALLVGRGLVHPVDRMDSAHPPSHPVLLDWLARDFRDHGYDVRRLVREIVASRTYQLASRSTGDGERPPVEAFAYGLEKPLSGEVLARSLRVALGVEDGEVPVRRLRRAVVERFPRLFPEEPGATVAQALFLSNNPLVASLLEPRPGSTSARLLELERPGTRAREAFLATLGRGPGDEELARARAYLRARADRPRDGVEQLLWALVTSAEFRSNH